MDLWKGLRDWVRERLLRGPCLIMPRHLLREWAFLALEQNYGTCEEPTQHPPFIN